MGTANVSTQTVVTSIAVNGPICAAFVVGFLLLRLKFKRVYQPKLAYDFVPEEKKPRPLPPGLFRWLFVLLHKPHLFILKMAGLDGYLFIRHIYIIGMISACGILMYPVLFTLDLVNNNGTAKGFDRLTMLNVGPKRYYYGHVVMLWVFYGLVTFTLSRELYFCNQLRLTVLLLPRFASKLSLRVVLFQGVPHHFLREREMYKLFDGIVRVWVARAHPKLQGKVLERNHWVSQLEKLQHKMLKKCMKRAAKAAKKNTPLAGDADDLNTYVPLKKQPSHRVGWPLVGKKVKTFDYIRERLPVLNAEIAEMQALYHDASPLTSVFVEFRSQFHAQMALQANVSHSPLRVLQRLVGIEPLDVVWGNMRILWWERLVRQTAAYAMMAALILLWAFPVAWVGTISNITYLTNKLHWLRWILNLPKWLLGVVTSTFPTIMLLLLMALLPVFIRAMAKVACAQTVQQVEHFTQTAYFVYCVVHVFLITTVLLSATAVVTQIVSEPGKAMELLALGLPKLSNFFVSYLLLQGFLMAGGGLFQILAFLMFYCLGFVLDNTVRKKHTRWTSLGLNQWGTIMPVYTNLAVIVLLYAIILPLILVFLAVCFLLLYIMYLHNITYIQVEAPDARGRHYTRAVFQMFTGVYLGQICLLGMFVVAKAWGPVVMAFIGLCFTLYFHLQLLNAYGPLLDVVPVDVMRPADGVLVTPSFPGKDLADILDEYMDVAYARRRLRGQRHALKRGDLQWRTVPSLADMESGPRGADVAAFNWFWRFFLPWGGGYHLVQSMLPDEYYEMEDTDEQLNRHAYNFPAVSAQQATVWIPRDPLGVLQRQIREWRGVVQMLDENAWILAKGKLLWEVGPPTGDIDPNSEGVEPEGVGEQKREDAPDSEESLGSGSPDRKLSR